MSDGELGKFQRGSKGDFLMKYLNRINFLLVSLKQSSFIQLTLDITQRFKQRDFLRFINGFSGITLVPPHTLLVEQMSSPTPIHTPIPPSTDTPHTHMPHTHHTTPQPSPFPGIIIYISNSLVVNLIVKFLNHFQ